MKTSGPLPFKKRSKADRIVKKNLGSFDPGKSKPSFRFYLVDVTAEARNTNKGDQLDFLPLEGGRVQAIHGTKLLGYVPVKYAARISNILADERFVFGRVLEVSESEGNFNVYVEAYE